MFEWLKRSHCAVGGKCSGCEWITHSRKHQITNKIDRLRRHWKEQSGETLPAHIQVLDLGDRELRNVVDVSFQRLGKKKCVLGFYDLAREKLINAAPCPALTPDLQQFLIDLADRPPPIDQASFRLRVNHHGQRGLWVDTSNLEIRTLLNEKNWLRSWLEDGHVEMGQRRKYVQDEGAELRLNKPVLRPWFSTPLQKANKDVPLWTVVGGFTQPSIQANRHLVHHVLHLAEQTEVTHWLEYGAGCGNFTLPFAERFSHITATEISPISREGLRKAAGHQKLSAKINISNINLQRNTKDSQLLIGKSDGLLVDPPRSGLHDSINALRDTLQRPQSILYVSCYARSLAKDGMLLKELGYTLKHIEGIDQFPNTPHCEWIALFQQ